MTELRRFEFGDIVVRELAYPAGAKQPRHDHAFGNITAVIRGEIIETTDAGEHAGRSCSVVVKPAGTPHADRIPGKTTVHTISVQFGPASPFAAQLGPWRWLEGNAGARAALTFQRALRDGSDVERHAHDFSHRILAMGMGNDTPPAWFDEMRAELDVRFAEPLRFERLARQFGMHPVYVSRAFHRYAGTSMREYVRALRLGEARHLLNSTRRSAAAIALDAGFADASHLTRTFATQLGLTPRAYRRLCQV